MSDNPLVDLFAELDIIVMQRVGVDQFFVHGAAPAWLRRVNARWKGERQILASRTFPFLDHFLVDAEAFWTTGTTGRIGSGLSTEPGVDGTDFHFEAWAVTVTADAQYLLLEHRRDGDELQAMLQRAREGMLEKEALQRTQLALEQSQGELRRARDTAESLAAARAASLATISHEVRTPVHAIIGLAGLLLESSLPPAQTRFLALIRSSSETLLTVLADMLDASRFDAGAVDVEARPFNLRQTVDEALDVVAVRASQRSIDLTCQVDLAVPESMTGDPARIRQVLVNLLSNAVKFTPSGDVLVVAEAQNKPDGRTELHFAVKDEGPGIAAEDLERLLTAPSVSDVDGGWTPRRGMGLAISRALVERMGGRLWADRAEGPGSTVHFTALVDVVSGPSSSPYLQARQPLLERRQVWILGGSPATQNLLINQTRFWGMVPRATPSAEELRRWLTTDPPPDVVLLDRATLAGADGLDHLPAPVVELVTLDKAQEAAARSGALLMTKPIKFARLHAHLVSLLAPAAGSATT
jgi:signal transduction histidine kinase